MKQRIDGRTARGLRIREQGRENILAAYINLIRDRVPAPTARETAARAGVSLRAVFNYFPDLRALRLAAFNRAQVNSSEFFSEPIPDRGSLSERLELFVRRHTQRLEYVTPLQRTAAMVAEIDPDVAQALRQARNAAARDLKKTLAAALGALSPREKRDLLTRLHLVCSWASWELLRTHYHLSSRRARDIIAGTALAILADAQRRVRA
jgi:TetR/AcrR family transcriptional regulator of autoinduction and epiphytic fitness